MAIQMARGRFLHRDKNGIKDGPANLHNRVGQSSVALGLLFPGDEGVVEWNAGQGDGDANQEITGLLQIREQH